MRNFTAIKLRVKILKHIFLLSGKYYTNKKTGNIHSIVQSGVDTIESIDAELAFSLIKNFITAIAALYFMFRIQYDLFLIVVILQIVLILLQKIFTKMIHENVSLIRKEYGEITHLIQEYVLNIMSIVISKSRRFFISNYINKDRKIVNRSIKTDMLYKGNMAVAITINSIISMILYGYGGYKIINGNLTLGSLLAFQSYSAMLLGPCMSIINANNRIQQAKVSIDRVYSPLDEKSEIYCKDRTIKIILLLRLWDVDKGEIYINKINLKEYNLNSLRKNISVVTQDSLAIKPRINRNIY